MNKNSKEAVEYLDFLADLTDMITTQIKDKLDDKVHVEISFHSLDNDELWNAVNDMDWGKLDHGMNVDWRHKEGVYVFSHTKI